MLSLHLACNRVGPNPQGKCTCSSFTLICSWVGTLTTLTTMVNQLSTIHSINMMFLRLWNAQVTLILQPSWPHPPR